MKKFIENIKNIWKVEELRKRIIFTLGLILIYRVGSFVVLPGVDSSQLSGPSNALTEILNLFAGGAFSRASILALGIMPYISASIIMQLVGIAVPTFQKMQNEGESGRKRFTNITRGLTIIICIFQAPGYISLTIPDAARVSDSPFWWITAITILVAGTMFVMWLGERITDKGIGNGISLIIAIGIMASLPGSLIAEMVSKVEGGSGGTVLLIVEMVIWLLVILFTVLLVQGVRRVPVQYAKSMAGGGRQAVTSQKARQYIPLKVNSSGVMPIIFAQAIMTIPIYVIQYTQSSSFASFTDIKGFWYNFMFAFLIIVFTYFYTAIMVNPKKMADDLKRNGGFIPGVKPGANTAEFIDTLLSRITLPGSIFLALIAILPAFAMILGVNQAFAMFFGGTSLLIMVGVVLDTLQQVESYLLNRHYDGLMEGARLRGRRGEVSTI